MKRGKAKRVKMAKENHYEVTEGNVFAAIGRKNADELLARAELLDKVVTLIENSGLLQHHVAKKLGITQPKVSALINGHLSEFSADTLLHYLSILGCEVEIWVKKPRRKSIFRQRGCIAVC
jgi:predicted XRE-type DNA-binding protein